MACILRVLHRFELTPIDGRPLAAMTKAHYMLICLSATVISRTSWVAWEAVIMEH